MDGDELVISKGALRRLKPSPADRKGSLVIGLDLGGPNGLSAIAYVAVTFFAHYFPDFARQPGLSSIKAYIQGTAENTFVWWESGIATTALPANPFEFGHTVILCTSTVENNAFAIISLFGSLTFGIELGRLERAVDRTITIFIDPHAEHPPADIEVSVVEAAALRVQKPEPIYKHLEQMVLEGVGQEHFQTLMKRIERWRFGTEMERELQRLNASVMMPVSARVRLIQNFFEGQVSRIHQMMVYVVREFTEAHEGSDEIQPVISFLNHQVELDSDGTRLTEGSELSLALVMAALIEDMNTRIAGGPIEMNDLFLLLRGGPGISIVGKAMLAPMLSVLAHLMEEQGR